MARKSKKSTQPLIETQVSPSHVVVETAPAPVVETAPATPVEVKPAKKVKVVEVKPAKKKGSVERIKELVIADPKLPAKDIGDRLNAEGFTFHASTPGTIRTDLLSTLRILQAAGHCRGIQLD